VTALTEYETFLHDKVHFGKNHGFDIELTAVNPILKPHQAALVRWAIRGGRRALFASFGLGKSVMQIEVLRIITEHKGGRGLIVAPLGVRQEFIRDAAMLGMAIKFIRRDEELDGDGLYITNYESIRDGKLNPANFTATTLDEASVLRSFGSKTYQTFLTLFDDVQYRFVATATPAPNRYKELIHYAGYLGVMDTGQALTRFFQRNSEKANDLTLYPHKEREFYLWLNTWAAFVQRPSDLGFPDDGYTLPPVEIRFHEVDVEAAVTIEKDGQARFLAGGGLSLKQAAKAKRDSIELRVAKAAEIVAANPDDRFILWHDLEDERHEINRQMSDVSQVFGSLDLDVREQRIIDFSNGDGPRLLATKPIISGSGCNFQRYCHRAVFVGVDFKFNDWIQAVHRVHRFLQTEQVVIDIVHTTAQRDLVETLMGKRLQHEELTETMSDIVRQYGLDTDTIEHELIRAMGVSRVEVSGDGWTVANNDCVPETQAMQENSIDLIVTSIPFSNHYEYTPSYNDFGHTDNNDHFWQQMDFLTPELLRILRPGRIYACHVKDRILFGSVTGAGVPTVSPFHMEATAHAMKHGFDYLGMITVVTDVVRENNQTYRLGYTEMRKDGTKMGVGSPEYILLFRAPQSDRSRGYADVPVAKSIDDYSLARWQVDAHAYWRSSGNRPMTSEELAKLPPEAISRVFTEQSLHEVYDYESHVQVGEHLLGKKRLPSTFMSLAPGSWHSEVWHDVNRMLTLNGSQKQRNLAMHVCPLQFDIVDRLIERYTNVGELVFDPFGGLFTVPLRAMKLGRQGRAVELNSGYFLDGIKYLEAEQRKQAMPSLFDGIDMEPEAAA